MRNKILVLIIGITFLIGGGIIGAEETSIKTERELNLLNLLMSDSHKLSIELNPDSSISKELDSDIHSIKTVISELERNNGKVRVQVFENITDTEVLHTIVDDIKDISSLEFKPPSELVEKYSDEKYYDIPYTIIISTPEHTGFYTFSRFYINDIKNIPNEELNSILEYNMLNNLDKPIQINFSRMKLITVQTYHVCSVKLNN